VAQGHASSIIGKDLVLADQSPISAAEPIAIEALGSCGGPVLGCAPLYQLSARFHIAR
jgi:hypothetical protein